MKSIIGQKIGMTQVFTKAGESIPVTVIKVEPNVVTNVLTKEKHGYNAIQLATIEQKKSRQKKPLVGHFQKAGTTPKKIVREMRDMNGYSLGEKVAVSIFKIGELVDVIGTSKGKGFAGSIKRHNQTIGPKSHGGGGGSKPVRQTGSLGEIKSNKVFKGMTMPGHLGHERVTVQNLEVINVDVEHDLLLIRGSIPGPKKSYVIVRKAIKGLKNKTGVELVDLKESFMKNKLLEEAKKYGASVNTDMSLEHMQKAVASAKDLKESQALLEQAQTELSKLTEQKSKSSNELTNYQAELAKVQQTQNQEEITALEEKIANLTHNIQGLDNKIAEINDDIKQKNEHVNSAQKTAKEYQLESDEKSTDLSTSKGAK